VTCLPVVGPFWSARYDAPMRASGNGRSNPLRREQGAPRSASNAGLTFIAGLAALGLGAGVVDAQSLPYRDASAFLNTLGVDVHLNYKDTAYRSPQAVARDLEYLSVRHLRQGFPFHWSAGGAQLQDVVFMSKAGFGFDFVVEAAKSFDPALLTARAEEIEADAPGSIEAIEGFNEINNWPVTYQGQKSVAAAAAAMAALYAAIKGDRALEAIPVYDMTGGPSAPSLAGRADFANAHPYPHNGKPPQVLGDPEMRRADVPRVITEIGDFSLPASWPAGKPWWDGYTMLGVDEESQAKSILLSYFDAAEAGVTRTYVYELLDERPDPAMKSAGDHYGLFHSDHSPKVAAVAIHNLTSFLKGDTARTTPLAPRPAPVELQAPADVHRLLLRVAEKRWVLALWSEEPFWRWTGPKAFPVDAEPKPVTIRLLRKARRITAYDCLTAKQTPLKLDGRTLEVGVTNSPGLVSISE
jgi:hypothetical protein